MKLIRSPRSRYRWREIAENLWNCGLHSREGGPVLHISVNNDKELFVLEMTAEEAQKLAKYVDEHSEGERLVFRYNTAAR